MKYIEHAKNVLLVVLVLLSILLTFTIWTYTPNYKTIQPAPTVDISISSKAKLDDVIQPYKVIYRFNDHFTGTTSPFDVERLMSIMQSWEIRDLRQEPQLTNDAMNEVSKAPNRFTMFFQADLPFLSFDDIVPFAPSQLPETGFNRIVVDWNRSTSGEMNIRFISSETGLNYSAKASKIDGQEFDQRVIASAVEFAKYTEIPRSESLSFFLPINNVEAINYTYILKEVNPQKFRDALFNDPNLVRRSSVGLYNDEYSDDSALMNVDLLERSFNYGYPSAEPMQPGVPSKLIEDSMDFMNEHGGWTDDFRLVHVQASNQLVEYQLYLLGYPVYSDMMPTKISTYWGNGRLYRYVRPYYQLDVSVPSATDITSLPSGTETVKKLSATKDLDLSAIDEVQIGYYLTRDDENRILTLQPSWFTITNGSWTRLTHENPGGATFGLE
ncbi:YycH family regulatory protein [Paenisporosarcina cavernae]|nr:two-component system activity regulator YycH [Paenisporosarcina cavernae]